MRRAHPTQPVSFKSTAAAKSRLSDKAAAEGHEVPLFVTASRHATTAKEERPFPPKELN